MKQPINAFLEFDERTVVGEVSNRSGNLCFFRVLLGDVVPRVRLSLLHAERDFLLVLVDAKHDHFDFVANLDEFCWVIDTLGPGHFGNVDEAFDAVFQLHERTVSHHVDDFAGNPLADRVFGFDAVPRA